MIHSKVRSLTFRITVWAVSVITVLLFVSAAIDYRTNSLRWKEVIADQTAEVGNFISFSLAPALWNYDQGTTDSVLNSAVDSKVIDAVYLVEGSSFRQGIIKKGSNDPLFVEELPDVSDMVKLPIVYEEAGEEPIATIYLKVNSDYLERTLNSIVQFSTIRTVVVGIMLAFVIYMLVKIMIKEPILQLTDAMRDIAEGEGDLTKRIEIKQNNEIGDLVTNFNQFMEKLQKSMSSVGSVSTEIRRVVENLESSFAESRSLVTEQRNKMDFIASAATEASASADEIANNTKTTSSVAEEAHSNAKNTQDSMDSTVQLIQRLNDILGNTSGSMTNLQSDVDSITEIMSVIQDIAEQTNLLALNAAIEAARAGEQGRGFAVVADEVRTLAARTQESTKEISEKIERLKVSTSEGMELFRTGSEASQKGLEQVEAAKASLSGVFSGLGQINDMSTHIESAISEQTTVIQELSENIHGLSDLSHVADEQVDKAGKCSNEVGTQTETLAQQLAGFKW